MIYTTISIVEHRDGDARIHQIKIAAAARISDAFNKNGNRPKHFLHFQLSFQLISIPQCPFNQIRRTSENDIRVQYSERLIYINKQMNIPTTSVRTNRLFLRMTIRVI